MPIPCVMISVLLEPHSPLHHCNFAAAPSSVLSPPFRVNSQQSSHFSSRLSITPPLHGPELVPTDSSASIWDHLLSSSSLSALYCSFPQTLSSFSGTSVLPFSRSVLHPLGYVSAIGLGVALALHCSRIERSSSPERWFFHGDPARFDDENAPYRKFPKAVVYAHGAPRQAPLQDYAAYAHPSLRPEQRALRRHARLCQCFPLRCFFSVQ